MKREILFRTNLVISLIIIAGFFITTFMYYYSYSSFMEDDIENISKLTSYTIYSDIDSKLARPVYVAQTMGIDTFLRDWVKREAYTQDKEANRAELCEYLKAIQNKYFYDSVFLISYKTDIYYYTEGINKTMSPRNAHDEWYYKFLNSNRSYYLDVDTDEANKNQQTVFINCRMVDTDGSLLAVVGVGVKMDYLQRTLKKYNDEFHLDSYLVSVDGTIQVHEDTEKIETANIFEEKGASLQDSILDDKNNMDIIWYPAGQKRTCLVARYIHTLDWYLIVEKDTAPLRGKLLKPVLYNLSLTVILLGLILFLTTFVVRVYEHKLYRVATTDELTGLQNRKYFSEVSFPEIAKNKTDTKLFFILDVDGFKRVNDEKGHLFGDDILIKIKEILENVLGSQNVLARWGGDEFIGVIFDTADNARNMLFAVSKEITELSFPQECKITVSIGGTVFREPKNMDILLEQADSALFSAKCSGFGKISLFHEE